jgi:hypothetical protein
MPTGYCTVEDVRRALRRASLPGDVSQDRDIAIDAIASQTRWLEEATKRHWYVPGGIGEDTDDLVPTGPKTRDDEYDLPRRGGLSLGTINRSTDAQGRGRSRGFDSGFEGQRARRAERGVLKEQLRLAGGDRRDESVATYTRIRLARKDVRSVGELSVLTADGSYVDWVASADYGGGVGTSFRGEDFWVRINSGGVAELYIDIHSLDDDIPALANAVYVDIDFGYEADGADDEKLRRVRRATASRAAADLVEEAVIDIPENATLYGVETKAEELRSRAHELLGPIAERDLHEDS